MTKNQQSTKKPYISFSFVDNKTIFHKFFVTTIFCTKIVFVLSDRPTCHIDVAHVKTNTVLVIKTSCLFITDLCNISHVKLMVSSYFEYDNQLKGPP